jgi:hypothetical protein
VPKLQPHRTMKKSALSCCVYKMRKAASMLRNRRSAINA